MAKATLTVEEVRKRAMANYNRGGDVIVECWEDKQIEDWINGEDQRQFHDPADGEFVPRQQTLTDLNNLFRLYRTTTVY
jgi:hypothetical protein